MKQYCPECDSDDCQLACGRCEYRWLPKSFEPLTREQLEQINMRVFNEPLTGKDYILARHVERAHGIRGER